MKSIRPLFVALLVSLLFAGPLSAQLQFNSPTLQQLQIEAGKAGAATKAPDVSGAQKLDPEQLKELGLTPGDLMNLEQVATLMKQQWVDGDSLKSQDLMWGAMKGMAKQLDPHSEFYTPDEYKQFQQALSGTFAGIGAILKQKKKGEAQTIQFPVPGAPAEKAGIKANDMIIEVDGKNVGPLSTEEVSGKIKGKPGTQVTLKIARPDPADPKTPKLLTLTIARDTVSMPNVYSEMIKPGVGYIYFTDFREDTANEFLKQLSGLERKGIDTLIVDERNNPGGSVQAVIKMTSLFQHKGEKILTMKDRKGNEKTSFTASEGIYTNLKVKVLINGNSASASEIFAGALQDNHHATIYGSTSFGKGSAQIVIPFPDGAALKLTINKWYTPSGKTIQGDEGGLKPGVGQRGGVAPDEPVTVSDAAEAKALQRIYQKLMGAPLDPAGPVFDPVLEKALQ